MNDNLAMTQGLEELKNKLIDTSRRNKLINYRRPSKARNLKIIDESAEFIYEYLVTKENKFSFASIPEPDIDSKEIEELKIRKKTLEKQLVENKVPSGSDRLNVSRKIESLNNQINELQRQALLTPEERAKNLGFNVSSELPDIDLTQAEIEGKYTDNQLQTLHYPNELEKILKNIERNARSIIEETGSNMLYLVLGVLKWQEANNSEHVNTSPLITIPVVLTKTKKRHRYEFTLEYSGEGIETNRSLAEKLLFEFGITLPELSEEISFRGYLTDVENVIKDQVKWSIKPEIALDFLHFGKILMYQDLKEENWEDGSLINNQVLHDIFIGKEIESDSTFAPEYDIDLHEIANNLPLVMDADSSQHSAIVDVLENKNVIIEGPPGTGKSQTISNIIAALLAQGKSVLFVSEKLAALEVVYKRLDNIGLSDFCLELHSHKAKKTEILRSVQKRLDTQYSDIEVLDQLISNIENKKKQIKNYLDTLHKTYGGIKATIYTIFWNVEKYHNASTYLKIDIQDAKEYDNLKLGNTIEELKKYRTFHEEYDFDNFFWKGFDLYKLDFVDIDDFIQLLENTKDIYFELNQILEKLPFEYDDEYEAIENIFQNTHKINFCDSIDKEIFKSVKSDVINFENILYRKEDLKMEIYKFYKALNKAYSVMNFNADFEQRLKTIQKMLEDIFLFGLQEDFSYKNIKYLLIGIESLSQLDIDKYELLNEKYSSSDIERIIDEGIAGLKEIYIQKSVIEKFSDLELLNQYKANDFEQIIGVIEEKKNSIFRILSGEYRTAVKKYANLLNKPLPKDKSVWSIQLEEIKVYCSMRDKYIKNSEYKDFFGKQFKGLETDWDEISELAQWTKYLRNNIANNRSLLLFFLDSSREKYIKLTEIKDDFSNTFDNIQDKLKELTKLYDRKFIQSLYSRVEEIDIVQFISTLQLINEDLKTLEKKVAEEFSIQHSSSFVSDMFLNLKQGDFDSIIYFFQSSSIDFHELLYLFEKIYKKSKQYFQYIDSTNQKFQLSLNGSESDCKKIYDTISLYKSILKLQIDERLKQYILEDINHKNIFQELNEAYTKLLDTRIEMKKFGNINKSFYANNALKLSQCISKLAEAKNNKKSLSIWSDFRKLTHSIHSIGLSSIINKVESKELPLDIIEECFLYNFYNTLIKEAFREYPILVNFSRLSHEQVIKKYKELDKQFILQNRKKVAYLASQRDVPRGYRSNKKSELTELSLIENEVSKKKRHIPIRQLVKRASKALQGLKPCFMMSPLSVSQYLPPNEIEFDVLVVDEASQLRPEEALGSIARAKQIVIVGDPKQLPPTSFFDSMEKTNDNDTVASESESILDICLNLYKPIRQLRWHYRSQHESLISFSNQQFYDSNLLVFPSPTGINSDELGIKNHYLDNATYQNRKNKVEAKVIIEHLERQMKKYPDKSIGIGTFNSDQRDMIQDLLDEKEKTSPIVANYIAYWKKSSEPFFIKNLENLQGDERDVIYISTTYGKDKDTHKVYQRFGPINSDTGWRRLNVMITRSKQKMEVFTSMKSSDINVSENSSRGVRALKSFLHFLETSTLTKVPEITGKGFDSEFEESVYNILSEVGYKTIPQVGVAGYFIDLAVVSEKNSNDFVLAIECDGATYHSSKSARDRDRLKQEVLEQLGWTVYRIWSVDWYKNREYEISKLIEAVKNAQLAYKGEEVSNISQDITIEEVKEIEADIDKEIEKEEQEHHHSEKELKEATYSQPYVTDETIKDMLIELRDTKIAQEFKIDKRCILSDLMIDIFTKYKPLDMDEFRAKIPIRYRNDNVIDINQMKYMPDIFEILELADE